MTREPARLSETALAALFLLLATAVFTWPVAAHVNDGLADLWDAKLNAWILHWDYHQTLADPLNLYDANIFHPARYSLAFSENLYGAALFGFPLYAAGVSTLAAYNALFLLGMFFSALTAWALARYVTGDGAASLLAAFVYAFCPWRIAQIPHIQFQWGAFFALALLFLLRYLDDGRPRDAVLLSVCLAWNALCNVHYALFSVFLVGVALLWEGLVLPGATLRRRLPGLALAGAAAAAVVVPFLYPYALASKLHGMQRGGGEIEAFSGVWTDFLTAGGQNKLYAPLTKQWAKAEGEFFPGIVVVVLAGIALARLRGPASDAAPAPVSAGRRRLALAADILLVLALALWAASALFGVVEVLGLHLRDPGRILVVATALILVRLALAFPGRSAFTDLSDLLRRMRLPSRAGLLAALAAAGVVVALGVHTPFYRFLVDSLGPTFHVIRAPSRGIVLFDLGLGVLAAWGLSVLTRPRPKALRAVVCAAALAATGFEYRAFPVDVHAVDPAPAPVDLWLASLRMPGAVALFPLGDMMDQEHEFRSTAHWKPIVNGASGFAPKEYVELASLLEKAPIRGEVWELLRRRGVWLVVFRPEIAEAETASFAEMLQRGVEGGQLAFLRTFPHRQVEDLVFRVASAGPFDAGPPPGEEAVRHGKDLLSALTRPPFGYIDVPDGGTVGPGGDGYGWALDDSGIASVQVAFDGGPQSPAQYGLPHPGPPAVYPNYPGVRNAGFAFRIPPLSPGVHGLVVTATARDGGRSNLVKWFTVKGK